MKAYTGTSGWMYSWNGGKSLGWYVRKSGLNAIELNASFYRYPSPNTVKLWSKEGETLKWAVKVNQGITHRHKMNQNSYEPFSKFKKLFKPLDKKIGFYLFQLPPILTPNSLDSIEKFQKKFDLGNRFALEARNLKWFNNDVYKRVGELGITMVSIDSPIGNFIMKTSKNVYFRFHGRKTWYTYRYSDKELGQVARKLYALKPAHAYTFFNNDHAMLPNARTMFGMLKRLSR